MLHLVLGLTLDFTFGFKGGQLETQQTGKIAFALMLFAPLVYRRTGKKHIPKKSLDDSERAIARHYNSVQPVWECDSL